jgi:hypothetical protein
MNHTEQMRKLMEAASTSTSSTDEIGPLDNLLGPLDEWFHVWDDSASEFVFYETNSDYAAYLFTNGSRSLINSLELQVSTGRLLVNLDDRDDEWEFESVEAFADKLTIFLHKQVY